jgi:hypothetical protein
MPLKRRIDKSQCEGAFLGIVDEPEVIAAEHEIFAGSGLLFPRFMDFTTVD